jgi:hypothetical protein
MVVVARVFIGTEALAAGGVTKYDLRARHQRVLPGVYAPKGPPISLYDRTVATWLWSRRQGIISGLPRLRCTERSGWPTTLRST